MAISDPARAAARTPWAAAVLIAACGCSGPTVTFAPVEGTVTRDGRPLARVQVIFLADGDSHGPRATGITDDAGRFRLTTDDGKTGAPVGRHRVCVIDATTAAERLGRIANGIPHGEPGKESRAKTPAGKTSAVPPAYGRAEETPFRAEVRPGAQIIDFRIP